MTNGRGSSACQQAKEDSGKFADAFIDLDPLGTGKNKPYVDKKFFFQDVKNPPKKVLKELSSSDVNFMANFQALNEQKQHEQSDGDASSRSRKTSEMEEEVHRYSDQSMFRMSPREQQQSQQNYFEPFEDPFELPPVTQSSSQQREERRSSVNNNQNSASLSVPLKVILPPETNRSGSRGSTPRNRSPNLIRERGSMGGDSSRKSSYDSTRRVRQSPVDYSGNDPAAPEPPPRPELTSVNYADPPPLPPKKSFGDVTPRTSNRPSLSSGYKISMSPRETAGRGSDSDAPPLPLPSRRVAHSDSRYPGPERPQKQEEDGYLVPTDPSSVPVLLPPPKGATNKRVQKRAKDAAMPHSQSESTEPIAEITLSQLLQLSMDELADKLNVSVEKLSTMTIVELTKYLSEFLQAKDEAKNSPPKTGLREIQKSEPNVFKVSFDDDKDATFVAVFDDNFGEEMNSMNDFVADFDNANIQIATGNEVQKSSTATEASADRYAVFREIFDGELKSENVPDLLTEGEVQEGDSPNSDEEATEHVSEQNIRLPAKIVDTSITATISQAKDRYAALRDLVLVENLFEAVPVKPPPPPPVDDDRTLSPTTFPQDECVDEHTVTMTNDDDDNFATDMVSDHLGDYDDDKTITSPSHICIESPEPDRTAEYESIKDKSVTPTFVSARDDLEIDELMNLAVSNLSLNNINSLSPQNTNMQWKNASTSPIQRAQQMSPLAQMAVGAGSSSSKANVIDTSTSPIIMHKMLSPVAFDRSSPQPASPAMVAPTTVVTPPITTEAEAMAEENKEEPEPGQELITDDNESPIPSGNGKGSFISYIKIFTNKQTFLQITKNPPNSGQRLRSPTKRS